MCLWSKCNVRKFEKVLQKYNLSKNSLVKCLSVDNKFDIWIRITGEIFCHKSLANLQIDFQIIFAIWFTNFFCYKFVLIFFNDISGILKYCFIYRHCPKYPEILGFDWLANHKRVKSINWVNFEQLVFKIDLMKKSLFIRYSYPHRMTSGQFKICNFA